MVTLLHHVIACTAFHPDLQMTVVRSNRSTTALTMCAADIQVPIYMSGPMAARANQYYRLLLNWTSGRVKQGQLGARPAAFAFSRAQPWQPELINQPVSTEQQHLLVVAGQLQGHNCSHVYRL